MAKANRNSGSAIAGALKKEADKLSSAAAIVRLYIGAHDSKDSDALYAAEGLIQGVNSEISAIAGSLDGEGLK